MTANLMDYRYIAGMATRTEEVYDELRREHFGDLVVAGGTDPPVIRD
jgi:hypothetical protein